VRPTVQVVILAGGYGTRLSEETAVKPKPMVEIGGKPLLWHIMKLYTHHGLTDFIVCCGYKSEVIKRYFQDYRLNGSDITFDLRNETTTVHSHEVEPWRVTLVDTGDATMTGGRLKRVEQFIDGETFCLAYGDCLSDVDIGELIRVHRAGNALVTLTAVQPPGRFGVVTLGEDEQRISSFVEKPEGDGGWVNGGFFVLERAALGYVDDDSTVWERGPLEVLASEGRAQAYRHRGYWQNLDSLRDKMVLEERWASGAPPWKVW